jgi:hypothetical protein
VDEQAVAVGFKAAQRAHQGFGRGTLKEGAGLGVDRRAQEVVFGGVANIEVNVRIERGELDEVRRAKFAVLARRRGG